MTLYEDIGGEDAIAAVVEDFYDRVLADDSLAPHFEDTSMDELRDHQQQFLGMVTGGPVEYSGADMRAAHEGMGITEEAFGRVATHLAEALGENGLEEGNTEAILDEVGALEPDVVEQ